MHRVLCRVMSESEVTAPVWLLQPWPDHFSGGRRLVSRLHRHPCVAKYLYIIWWSMGNTIGEYTRYTINMRIRCTAASDIAHSSACSNSASQSSLSVGLLWRLPTSPCLSRFQNNCFDRRTLCKGPFLYSCILIPQVVLTVAHCLL